MDKGRLHALTSKSVCVCVWGGGGGGGWVGGRGAPTSYSSLLDLPLGVAWTVEKSSPKDPQACMVININMATWISNNNGA